MTLLKTLEKSRSNDDDVEKCSWSTMSRAETGLEPIDIADHK
jgi:hypothetical protein